MISCDKCWADWASPAKEWHYHGCRSRAFDAPASKLTPEVAEKIGVRLDAQDAALRDRVRALLKRIETRGGHAYMCGYDERPKPACPACGNPHEDWFDEELDERVAGVRHTVGCEIAALLRESGS